MQEWNIYNKLKFAGRLKNKIKNPYIYLLTYEI